MPSCYHFAWIQSAIETDRDTHTYIYIEGEREKLTDTHNTLCQIQIKMQMQIRLPELQLQMQIQIQALCICICICICITNTHNVLSMYALRSLWIDDWAAGHRRISSNRNEVIVLLLLSIWLVTSLVRSLYLSLHLCLFLSLSYKKIMGRPMASITVHGLGLRPMDHGIDLVYAISNTTAILYIWIYVRIFRREKEWTKEIAYPFCIYIYICIQREGEIERERAITVIHVYIHMKI